MKKLLTTLSVLALGTTTGNFSTLLNTNVQKNILNNNQQKTQQDTIYIDKDGKQVSTSEENLSNLDIKEIVQIGFFENANKWIEVVRMPKTIEKVPNEIPQEIKGLNYMFQDCTSFNQDLSKWNTSNVTDMTEMFKGATSFNQDISSWDTSNVGEMDYMFDGASSFNQDISSWDTSNVVYMTNMFFNASLFNQNISKWNTSKVKNMSYMFYGAISFNQDLSKWNVGNVEYYDNFSELSALSNDKIPKWGINRNSFEVAYRSFAHDWIRINIAHNEFKIIKKIINNFSKEDAKKIVISLFNKFEQLNHTGSGGSILNSDYDTAYVVIFSNFKQISDFFDKLPFGKGIEIVTNRIGSWNKNDGMGFFQQ